MNDLRNVSLADSETLTAAVTGEGLLLTSCGAPFTPELAADFRETVALVRDEFRERFAAMTVTRAEFVRHLRCDKDYTWCSVAQTCALEWREDWNSSQLAGMALCERAASFFGEDYLAAPWN